MEAKAPFPATSAPLLAASFLLDAECRQVNDVFMQCRAKHEDPEQCCAAAQAVLDCSAKLFERVAGSKCQGTFEKFWRCLDMNNHNNIYCRSEEFAFDDCTRDNLEGLEKRLWSGSHPREGYKARRDRPELESWSYQMHVWSTKKAYE